MKITFFLFSAAMDANVNLSSVFVTNAKRAMTLTFANIAFLTRRTTTITL